jgi:two-component system, sensor histidine kinase and response regulator
MNYREFVIDSLIRDHTVAQHSVEEPTQQIILIVDDDLAFRMLLRKILSEQGYTVIEAEDGQQALAMMIHSTPDLIISDIRMPQMDGFELFKRLSKNPQWSGLPFIYLTAYNDYESYRQSKELGVDDFLSKPVDMALLISVIKGRLHRAGQIKKALDTELDTIKKKLLHLFSHEFRTPLTHIKGVSDILTDESVNFDEDSLKKFYQILKDGTDRLQILMEEFLTVARIEASYAMREARQFRAPFVLSRIVDEVKLQFMEKARDSGISLIKEMPSQDVRVVGCEAQIREILRRLMENAMVYTPSSGVIKLCLTVLDRAVSIEVQDTGRGIESHELPHIFERFYQVGRNRVEQQGIGLGLYIARTFAEINGGTLNVTSTPGVGSKFTLLLPQ